MFECLHCHEIALVWQADFDFEDYGYEGKGIVSEYICSKCGTRITMEIPIDKDEEDKE